MHSMLSTMFSYFFSYMFVEIKFNVLIYAVSFWYLIGGVMCFILLGVVERMARWYNVRSQIERYRIVAHYEPETKNV